MKMGINAWLDIVKFVWRYFSIGPLLKTLFIPWHRDLIGPNQGFTFFERLVFSILSRLLGAISRLFIIAAGLVSLALAVILLPLFILPIPVNIEKLNHRRALGRGLAFRFTPRLRRYARDLSLGSEVRLVGKAEAIRRLEQVLAREHQNNALIVGKTGVGRTTLVIYFAQKVAWGQTLPSLQYRYVFELQLEGLNQTELRYFLTEAVAAGNVILVIDNIHNYPEALNTLLPFTDISSLQIIGITDFEGFHSELKKRADFLQRFEKIEVAEASADEVTDLVVGVLRAKKVKYDPAVPAEIVKLTNRLVFDLPQPEKSLDVVEELLASRPAKISLADVQELLSAKTGVPAGRLSEKERQILLDLEERMRAEIIGQDEAVRAIASALRRARSGLAPIGRPVGSFLFLGPTGVGKTHTAKILAATYYGSDQSMIRFDMSEFAADNLADDFTHRLVVAIEEDPFTLVLFDEIEKANSAVHNLFLQILDEAHITDSTGRKAHFNNALIICTSNAGNDLLTKNRNISRQNFLNELIRRGDFSPEFLNRFDETVLFMPLAPADIRRVVKLMLGDLAAQVKRDQEIVLNYDDSLIKALGDLAFNSVFGARSIRRVLQDTVTDYLAEQILKNNLKAGDVITVSPEVIVDEPVRD